MAPREANRIAVAAFALAMFGVAVFVIGPPELFSVLWIPGTVLLLVLGYKGKSQIDRSEGTQGGRKLATVAIVLGWIGAAVLAFIVFLFFFGSV